MFTRLLYNGTVHLNRTEDETWLTPFGLLMDLWECHRQFTGMAKARRELFIEDVIPDGV